MRHAFDLARSLQIDRILVQATKAQDIRFVEQARGDAESVIWLATDFERFPVKKHPRNLMVQIPQAGLLGANSLDLGIFLAIFKGYVTPEQYVLCLKADTHTRRVSSLFITKPIRCLPWLKGLDSKEFRRIFAPQTYIALVEIALRFGIEGREGSPIGTAFVLGQAEQLTPHLKQLILNPCKGHQRKIRNVHNPEFVETLREYAALDGAFIVNEKGVVESAGTYLAVSGKGIRIQSGLGARHAAAAAITSVTDAVAVVLSQSSGTVTTFHKGRALLELAKPKAMP